jgi:hypothetical protein
MIKTLQVKNFKSLKHLEIKCKRINIFVGEPNTGKSNILESIGIFSFPFSSNLRDFVRFETMSNLFYDENLDGVVKIQADEKILEIKFENSKFKGRCVKGRERVFHFDFDYDGRGMSGRISEVSAVKFYRFAVMEKFPKQEADFLHPPSGGNLLSILMAHKELKAMASEIFQPFGLRLVFKPQEKKIEVLKQYEDVLISYPYSLISETLQRIIFYLIAINSNKNSILIFEEPESHAFPYYTKFLAEAIALDNRNNQYFISTHNPYFLLSIVEKALKRDVSVFITYFKNYETKVKRLSEEEMEEVLEEGVDIFFNLERFVEQR